MPRLTRRTLRRPRGAAHGCCQSSRSPCHHQGAFVGQADCWHAGSCRTSGFSLAGRARFMSLMSSLHDLGSGSWRRFSRPTIALPLNASIRRAGPSARGRAPCPRGELRMATPSNSVTPEDKRTELRRSALEYHEFPTPGKGSVTPTKQLTKQRDLALAYSPGVAAPCQEILADPANAYKYTARGNLVAVISNGTAVRGLGNIGALASKPVMEGKGVLFKKFAGIDVFDIEINEQDPDKLID